MAIDAALSIETSRPSRMIASAALVALLLLVLVGLEPFRIRSLAELQRVGTGEGDLVRQISYFAIGLLSCLAALQARFVRAFSIIPLGIVIVLAWCLLSTFWSIAPDISLRRAVLTATIAVSVFFCVDLLGPERSLRVLYAVLTVILCLDLLSIVFVPQAVHQLGELDAGLVGNWRGLHPHKNQAGAIASMSALVFLHVHLQHRRPFDLVLFALAAVFTVGTASKTSIAILVVVTLATFLYAASARSAARMKSFRYGVYVIIGVLLVLSVVFYDDIIEILGDRSALTGRGAIWQLSVSYILEQPLIGSGFGAFWQSGPSSPVLDLARDTWLRSTSHSHNGYIEVTVNTGLIGLTLALLAFVVAPLRRLILVRTKRSPLVWSLFLSFVLLNLTETRLLERDRPEWVIFLVALAILYSGSSRSSHKALA